MSLSVQIRLPGEMRDINPILLGYSSQSLENDSESHSRSYVLIHYITGGRGTVIIDGKTYHLEKGQAFLLHPSCDASWFPDPDEPWSFRWVGFTGTQSHHFSALPPVFTVPPEVLALMCDPGDSSLSTQAKTFRIISELSLLYSILSPCKSGNLNYAQIVMDYVRENYMHKISIQSISDSLNLSRCYLSSHFKKRVGTSIQQYILNTRIEAAKKHLLLGKTVKETCMLSGFNDISNFTKTFLRQEGATPSSFRQDALNCYTDYIAKKEHDDL